MTLPIKVRHEGPDEYGNTVLWASITLESWLRVPHDDRSEVLESQHIIVEGYLQAYLRRLVLTDLQRELADWLEHEEKVPGITAHRIRDIFAMELKGNR